MKGAIEIESVLRIQNVALSVDKNTLHNDYQKST